MKWDKRKVNYSVTVLSKLNRENVIWKTRCEQTFEGGEEQLWRKDSTERARRKAWKDLELLGIT